MLEGLYRTGSVCFLRIVPGWISHPALDSLKHFSCKCLCVVIKAEGESGYVGYSVSSPGDWLSFSCNDLVILYNSIKTQNSTPEK